MKKSKLKSLLNIKTIIVLFIILSIPYFDLPGLYMDAVNPDYVGLHVIKPATVPAWIFNDNIIAAYFGKMWNYPLLNSLYGTNFTAYIYILFATILGSGVATVRIMHLILGILELLAIYYALFKTTDNKNIASLMTLFIAIEPSFIFAQRTQYYLQLFPVIFFMFGIYFLNKKNILNTKENKNIIIPSILFGLAASSYFIFAGYYLGVVISIIAIAGFNKKSIKKVFISILGFIIGYIPYLYGHLSLLINNGLEGYINHLKGLDTYGISDGQTGFFNRIVDIINENYSLSSGDSIINMITGQSISFPIIKAIFFIIALVSIILTSIYIIKLFMRREKKNKETLTLLIITNCIVIHYIIGLIVGTSLGYQHYIMILPLYYMIICLNAKNILSNPKTKIIVKRTITISAIILVFINITNTISGYEKINKTGGIEYYSSTINDLSYYLNSNIKENDLIICPQWGYSMGISIITAGKTEIWNSLEIEEVINRLNNNEKEYGKIYIIDDNVTNDESIMEIVKATEKKELKEIPFLNDNNTLQVKLLVTE